MAWLDDAIGQLMMQMQMQQLVGQPMRRDNVVDPALGVPSDNRDMQVQAPGQSQFPSQIFGLLLGPNAAGIYGRGERPAPEGDVVLPSAGYRDASSRNAYALRPDENPVIRKFNESTLELNQPRTDGFRRINYADPITQLMMQMQLRSLMGGNQR